MEIDKRIIQHYLATGILGAYETALVEYTEIDNGKTAVCFTDTEIDSDDDNITAQRLMDIEGRRFRICSVFSSAAQATATETLLRLIDAELEQEARTD